MFFTDGTSSLFCMVFIVRLLWSHFSLFGKLATSGWPNLIERRRSGTGWGSLRPEKIALPCNSGQPTKSKTKSMPNFSSPYYEANYANFETELYSQIRCEAFGKDIGQNSWLTADEHDTFLGWLALASDKT